MSSTNCFSCAYLSKRDGVSNYFIYKCSYWGIVTQNILPQSVIISSIGKKCPFYKNKMLKNNIDKNKSKKNNKRDNNGLDLMA